MQMLLTIKGKTFKIFVLHRIEKPDFQSLCFVFILSLYHLFLLRKFQNHLVWSSVVSTPHLLIKVVSLPFAAVFSFWLLSLYFFFFFNLQKWLKAHTPLRPHPYLCCFFSFIVFFICSQRKISQNINFPFQLKDFIVPVLVTVSNDDDKCIYFLVELFWLNKQHYSIFLLIVIGEVL